MGEETQHRLKIDRPLYEQEQLHRDFEYEKPHKNFADRVISGCTSCRQPSKLLSRIIPILEWLPHYKWRRDLFGDLTAGITVAIMHIPQGMAYSLLGNVPAVVGIYMAFFPVMIYFLLGTSKHNSMGTFAIVCLMTGKAVLEHSDHAYFASDLSNTTVLTEGIGYSPIEVATVVSFTVALFQLLMFVFQLGIVSTLLSETLVSGFTTAAAFQVLTSQIKDLLGLSIPKHKGVFVVVNTWISIIQQLSNVNSVAILVSTVTVVVMTFNNELLKPQVAKKCAFPIPIELAVVAVGTFSSQFWELHEVYQIKVVGHIPSGLPVPAVPRFDLIKDIYVDAFTIAIVSYAMGLSMALIFAQKLNYEVDANQELLAQGAGNMFGSFFACMPFTASMSRSLIQETAGGKTQMTSLVSCGALFLVLMWIGPLFEPLPKGVLAGIIVVALKGMLFQVSEFFHFWKLSKVDAFVWIITFLIVLFVSIDIGLAVGLLLSLGTIIYLGSKPYTCLLGLVPHTDLYLDVNRYKMAKEIPGIKIFHYRGGINFASRNMFKSELLRLTRIQPHQELMLRKKLAKIEAAEEDTTSNVFMQKLSNKIFKLRRKTTFSIKCLILDFSAVSYIDPSGTTMLKFVGESFQRIEIPIYIAGCCGPVYETMCKCKVFNVKQNLRIFPTVHDAVQCATVVFNVNPCNSVKIIS